MQKEYNFTDTGTCTNPDQEPVIRKKALKVQLFLARHPDGHWCYGYRIKHIEGESYFPCRIPLQNAYAWNAAWQAGVAGIVKLLKELFMHEGERSEIGKAIGTLERTRLQLRLF